MGGWNTGLYQSAHSFVWRYGEELVDLLAPLAGERILDAGCGTGQLTARIAQSGAGVVGVDQDAGMIAEARRNFPLLRFEIGDLRDLPYRGEFEAAFSNAVLHWVREADTAAASLARALKPGGRFLAELGGKGNVAALLEALYAALRDFGVADPDSLNPWYYPDADEYAAVLERAGFTVRQIHLFARPTPLAGGLAAWLEMFGGRLLQSLDPALKPELLRRVEHHAAPALLRNGVWHADYSRLRVAAQRRM
ncbi:MAG: methyltransferase domain-containing protein [Acidobacteria bacterium]|nr:methyltransferase domain-containing protein [Acidobacteriota bacterium]